MANVKPTSESVFIKMDSALTESITFKSGVSLLTPSYLDREKFAACIGIVHSKGDFCTLNIEVGDEVLVSYQMVSDYTYHGDEPVLHRLLNIEGEFLWKADWLFKEYEEHMILAKKVGDRWHPTGNYVFLKEALKPKVSSFLALPPQTGSANDSGYFYAGGLELQEGDKVYWGFGKRTRNNEGLKAVYVLPNSEEFIIMNKEFIYGRESKKTA